MTPNDDGSFTGHLKLKGETSGTIKDLPYGTVYDVSVKNANQDSHKTTIEDNTGVMDENKEVEFTNERNLNIPNTLDNVYKDVIIFAFTLLMIVLGASYLRRKGTNN